MSVNVFKNPWKIQRHPLRWARHFVYSFMHAYQRATKGYCNHDLWDLCAYYTDVISGSLHELADCHMGYPGDITSENWTAILHELAEHLEKSNEKNELLPQPKTDAWYEHFNTMSKNVKEDIEWQTKDKELAEAMHEESKELEKLREIEKDIALDMLKKYWYYLWD